MVIAAVLVDSNQAYLKVESYGTFANHFKMSESMVSSTTSCMPILVHISDKPMKKRKWREAGVVVVPTAGSVTAPSSVLMVDAIQPLTDAEKQYLTERYINITGF
ncbi:hypothetical protein C5167_018091 [Papaver somniferum]|uniref:Uncharacterized protein n=1 Tax=Papaver somniferum TaxID=3469 RepID=A0A4Y7IPK7_PAPSO|nr:hypothetical protein C5167_018091 [Papaver somniferum]